MLPWEGDNGAEQVERASHLSIKRKGISVRDPGECSSLMVRVVWHVQGSQARPGVKGRQPLRRLMLHSLPGAQTSLSSSSQTSITWHNMQRAMWPTGWEKKKVPIFKCSHCHHALSLQARAHLPAPCPFPSHLSCWAYLLVPQEQYKRSQQMNSSLLGQPAPLNELGICWVACVLSHNLLYFSEGRGGMGPCKTFCLLIWNHGNSMTHFVQDVQPLCQGCRAALTATVPHLPSCMWTSDISSL